MKSSNGSSIPIIAVSSSTPLLPVYHRPHFPSEIIAGAFDVYRDQVELAISPVHRRSVHRLRPINVLET